MPGLLSRNKAVVVLFAGALFAAGLFVTTSAFAEPGKGKKKAQQAAYSAAKPPGTGVEKKDTGPVVPGELVEKKVEKLSEKIDWQTSLDEAKSLARKQHKPIFWIHVLGDLDGEC